MWIFHPSMLPKTCYSRTNHQQGFGKSRSGVRETNIDNCQYQNSSDKAIAEIVVAMSEAFPHGSDCPAIVLVESGPKWMSLQSRCVDMSSEVQRHIEHGGIGKKASPVRSHHSRGSVGWWKIGNQMKLFHGLRHYAGNAS